MKRLYNQYINFLESLPGYHQYYKMLFAENFALWKKRKLINSVKWSKEQNDEFDEFWKKNYKKIKKSGNKLYEAFNGNFNAKYVPDFLFATKIESQLNSYRHARIYSDKSLTEILYKDRSKALLPKTILLKSGELFYDQNRNIINTEQAKEILSHVRDCVIKPTIGGNSGKGVVIGLFDENGFDKANQLNVYSLIDNTEDDFIVQEKIEQSKALHQLYPNSINTFRVITYVADSIVHVAPISLRTGAEGNKVDNIHSGGVVIGVNTLEETLKKIGYKLGYSDNTTKYLRHPDTNIEFQDYKIPGISKIIQAAKKLHGYTPNIRFISWDFTLNKNEEPVIIEANYTGQSVWFPQIVNSESIFGENTESILNSIK